MAEKIVTEHTAPKQVLADIIDVNGPNRDWGVHRVEVVLQQWDYRKAFVKDVGGNCRGMELVRCAVEAVAEECDLAGSVTLVNPIGDELLIDAGSLTDDWEEEVERMVVSVRIVGYQPPTLNQLRARRGADPVPEGDAPYDPDADKVADRAALAKAEGRTNG